MMEKVLFCNYIVPQRPHLGVLFGWSLWALWSLILRVNRCFGHLPDEEDWRSIILKKGEATSNMSLYSDISAIFKWVIWIGNFSIWWVSKIKNILKVQNFSKKKKEKKKKPPQLLILLDPSAMPLDLVKVCKLKTISKAHFIFKTSWTCLLKKSLYG